MPRETTVNRQQRIVILCLGSAFLVAAAIYAGYRFFLSYKVEARIKQIRSAGLPVTTAELNAWYPAVPAEENAALTLTNAFAHWIKVNTNTSNLPIIGRGKLPPRNEPLPPDMRQAISEYVATNQAALQLVRRALSLKRSRYPVDLTPGWEALLPHLTRLKDAAQLLALKTLVDAEHGEPEEAFQSVGASLELADTLREEPLLISHLVRISCFQTGCRCLEQALARVALMEKELRQIQELLPTADRSNELMRAIVSERCIGLQLANLPAREFLSRMGEDTDPSTLIGFWITRVTGHGDFDKLFFLDGIDSYLQAAELPLPARLGAAQKVSELVQRNRTGKYPYLVSGRILPATIQTIYKDAIGVAHVRATRAALAIECFRSEHDSQLPDSWAELVPRYLDAVPTDPFDARPLRCKVRAKGYVVYSVGLDGVDNDGTEMKTLSHAQRLAGVEEPSDITFTVER